MVKVTAKSWCSIVVAKPEATAFIQSQHYTASMCKYSFVTLLHLIEGILTFVEIQFLLCQVLLTRLRPRPQVLRPRPLIIRKRPMLLVIRPMIEILNGLLTVSIIVC